MVNKLLRHLIFVMMILCVGSSVARIKPKKTEVVEGKGTVSAPVKQSETKKESSSASTAKQISKESAKSNKIAKNESKSVRNKKKSNYRRKKTYLNISSNYESFSYNGGVVTFNVDSNNYWEISTSTYSWGKLEKNGNRLALKVEPNNSNSSRTDYFVLKAGNTEKRVNIYQSGKPEVSKASDKVVTTSYLKIDGSTKNKTKTFRERGGRETYSVSTSAGSYEIWGVPEWCSIENRNASGFTLVCKRNDNSSSRSDYLEVKAAGKKIKIDIKQEANTAYVSTSGYGGNYYSSYNSSYNYRHKSFNEKKDDYVGGFSVGYFQKQWTFEENDKKEKGGIFDEDKFVNGIQAGFRIDPQFGYGIGMNTGLFYEYCFAKSNTYYNNYTHREYYYKYNEHGIYMPAHLKFTMNFSEWFQLSFFGGAGLNYVFSGKMKLYDEYNGNSTSDVFDRDNMKKFNIMLEYGASIRIKAIQFDFNMSQGLTNWSDTSGKKIKQGRPMSVSATICF